MGGEAIGRIGVSARCSKKTTVFLAALAYFPAINAVGDAWLLGQPARADAGSWAAIAPGSAGGDRSDRGGLN